MRTDLPTFPVAARSALADTQLRENLRRATGTIQAKRASVVEEVPDWTQLTEAGRRIKDEALGQLDLYLSELETSVTAAGGRVHRARDGAEANRIVGDLVEGEGASSVVKVKSITTDEIGLNQALAARGVQALETDLAELIIQLAQESSSHFLVPAIHKNRRQIRDLFREHLQRPDLTDEPRALAEAARIHLREAFLAAEVAVSGANFACADTGTVAVVESEGNGRMCLTLPRVLITVMGIEKVIPSFQDLEVFLQLLPRSATGERMNPYTSLWTGVHGGDGPEVFHLVLLDNGRTRVLQDPVGRQALRCIRCSACLNICPVYRRVGGHAYHSAYPGPIGSVLTPQLRGPGSHDSLPFASTLCGACAQVCPVRIEIPRLLLHLREGVVGTGGGPGASHRSTEDPGDGGVRRAGPAAGRRPAEGGSGPGIQERWLMAVLGFVFRRPSLYRRVLSTARWLTGLPGVSRFLLGYRPSTGWGRFPSEDTDPAGADGESSQRWLTRLPGYGKGWTQGRDFPPIAHETFREWWRNRGRATDGRMSAGDANAAVGPGGGTEPHGPRATDPEAHEAGYRVRGDLDSAQRLALLEERLEDYRATVKRCRPSEIDATILGRLESRDLRSLVVPEGLPEDWIAGATRDQVEIQVDRSDSRIQKTAMAAADGALTGCTLAIAETGTLVLSGGATEGRRALSLLPDYHLCVVFSEQVVETVPEAIRQLRTSVAESAPPLTFISGPSATSDIELVRVEGVHGPRTLDVILVEEA